MAEVGAGGVVGDVAVFHMRKGRAEEADNTRRPIKVGNNLSPAGRAIRRAPAAHDTSVMLFLLSVSPWKG